MKTIPLTQGYEAKVDDEDYERLIQYSWQVRKKGTRKYAYRSWREGQEINTIPMHRDILGLASGDPIIVDHDDGNGLNNQKYNLIETNKRGNALNTASSKDASHVTYDKGGWVAQLKWPGKKRYLGRRKTREEAVALVEETKNRYANERAASSLSGPDRRVS